MNSLAYLCMLVIGGGCASTGAKAPPGSAEADVVKVQLGAGGVWLEGRASYGIEQRLQRELPRQGNEIAAYFGTDDVYFVRGEVLQLHRRIMPLLAGRLKNARAAGDGRFVFDVAGLEFYSSYVAAKGALWPSILLQVRVQWWQQGQVVFEDMLMEQVYKEELGGRQDLKGVCALLAERLAGQFADWTGGA